MPLSLEKRDDFDLLEEIRAFVRGELTARRLWRQRAFLGRRAAFARLEAYVFGDWAAHFRRSDDERMRFVSGILDTLEAIGAVDFISAGRWAEQEYDDPMDATRPVADRGQNAPHARLPALNARRGKPDRNVR